MINNVLEVSNIKIRHMENMDIDKVMIVENNCFSLPWSKESFKYEIDENEKAIYIVAEYNDSIIGYAGMWKILDEGHITNIAVLDEFRHNGVGTKLIEELLVVAKSERINSFTLEVRVGNEVARKLYENFGFRAEGIRKSYYEDNREDALIMWKR